MLVKTTFRFLENVTDSPSIIFAKIAHLFFFYGMYQTAIIAAGMPCPLRNVRNP